MSGRMVPLRSNICLEVRAPDGRVSEVELAPGRVRVGRAAPGHQPDVVLDPDPQRWVGRLHCLLDFEAGAWWLADNGTVNGTFLRRGRRTERVLGRVRLQDDDVIRILGGMTDGGEPRYWDLMLKDPFATRQAPVVATAGAAGGPGPGRAGSRPGRAGPEGPERLDCLEYDWPQAKLFRHQGSERREVGGLSPLAHKLVRYMVDRARANGGVPVACTHAELIRAVWGEGDGDAGPHGFTAEHLRDLVFDLRKRLEPERPKGAASRLLETVPGIGYRLVVCPGGEDAGR